MRLGWHQRSWTRTATRLNLARDVFEAKDSFDNGDGLNHKVLAPGFHPDGIVDLPLDPALPSTTLRLRHRLKPERSV